MATLGSVPMKLRIRIEAGIGNTLTDIGHADLDLALPVQVTAAPNGAGATLNIDTDDLQRRISAAADAFEHVLRS